MKKKNICVVILVGIILAVLCTVDNLFWQDISTGFCKVGSHWVRYAAVAAAMAVCSFQALSIPADSNACPHNTTPVVALRLAMLVCAALSGVMNLLNARTIGGEWWLPILGGLELLSAVWLAGRCVLEMGEPLMHIRTGVSGNIVASFSLYLLTLVRFVAHQTGIVRVGVTMSVFSAVAALLLAVSWLRMITLPDNVSGRKHFLYSAAAFLLSTCMELPRTLCLAFLGRCSIAEIACSLGLAAFGVLGVVTSAQSGETNEGNSKYKKLYRSNSRDD